MPPVDLRLARRKPREEAQRDGGALHNLRRSRCGLPTFAGPVLPDRPHVEKVTSHREYNEE